ncbi:phage protein [Geomicrobium sp. JCM 19037]|uniref:phage terminase large subunit n=1 Tax=Geomicrobium sp. JCM 19037 TaxID=1460634 RepID=UPI00045F32F3|nr:phage terminase large subunit [Geomicrobium sp. JCM 19037]GAK03265.1 phage protein [Geomicrobium sp. JCM 19037]
MKEGVKVLWPEVQPILKLMKFKWDEGSKPFNTEYMNNPIDEESMIFNPDQFTYWTDDIIVKESDFKNNRDYDIGFGVDVAMGKERGDFSALIVTARHKPTDTYFIIDSFVERVKPPTFIEKVVEKVIEWQPDVIAAEAQAAQEYIVDDLRNKLNSAGYPANTRVKKIYQRNKKELRIESLQGDVEIGKIQFSRNHAVLIEQFERYGTKYYDDGPDGTEMSISALKKRRRRVVDKPAFF